MIKTGSAVFMKVPWGIIAAVCLMFCSFATVAVVVFYSVDNALTIEGSEAVGLFDTWYQTLLFVADILALCAAVAAIVFYALRQRSSHRPRLALPEHSSAATGGGESSACEVLSDLTAAEEESATALTEAEEESATAGSGEEERAEDFDALYASLDEGDRARADALCAYVRAFERVTERKAKRALTFRSCGGQVLKLRIAKGRAVAAFVLESDELKDYRKHSATRIPLRETRITLSDDDAVASACGLADMAARQNARERAAVAERRLERRRAARAAAREERERDGQADGGKPEGSEGER